MPLAFCILAHKNPDQVARLLRAIWQEGNTYVLHYDRRASRQEHRQIRDLQAMVPGLHVMPPRAVNWGRWSQMQTQLDMMKAALAYAKTWSHLFTISGQDLPLRSPSDLHEEMAGVPRNSFISWFDPLNDERWPNAEVRLRKWFLDSPLLERVLCIPGVGRRIRRLMRCENSFPILPGYERRPPAYFQWRGGSNHHVLMRESVRHLVDDPAALRIAAWLRHSGHPDETYVQSALLNSPLAATVVNDDRRAIFWDEGAASPRTLTLADLPRLREAREQGKLFARKFDPAVDAGVIQELERDLES